MPSSVVVGGGSSSNGIRSTQPVQGVIKADSKQNEEIAAYVSKVVQCAHCDRKYY